MIGVCLGRLGLLSEMRSACGGSPAQGLYSIADVHSCPLHDFPRPCLPLANFQLGISTSMDQHRQHILSFRHIMYPGLPKRISHIQNLRHTERGVRSSCSVQPRVNHLLASKGDRHAEGCVLKSWSSMETSDK